MSKELLDMLATALNDAVRRIEAEGYVVSGEISFIKPKTPGLVATRAVGYVGQINRLQLQTVKIAPVLIETGDNKAEQKDYLKTALGVQSDSPPCVVCGTLMVRLGGCFKCLNCGEQGGCG